MVLRGNTRTRFSVQADNEHGTLARVLDLFAVRGLSYNNMSAHSIADGQQWIELDCSDVEDQQTHVIMNKLRGLVAVRAVRVETMVLASV